MVIMVPISKGRYHLMLRMKEKIHPNSFETPLSASNRLKSYLDLLITCEEASDLEGGSGAWRPSGT